MCGDVQRMRPGMIGKPRADSIGDLAGPTCIGDGIVCVETGELVLLGQGGQ